MKRYPAGLVREIWRRQSAISFALPTRVGASLLAHFIESKCDDALPIHRQCNQLRRLGFDRPESTAYGYWRYATDLVSPVANALLGTVLDDPYFVGIDDTDIDVLDKTAKGGKYRGHLWCFRGSRKGVAYAFTKTWKAKKNAPWIHAIPIDTYIQVDDYNGYSALIENPYAVKEPLVPVDRRLGCMIHVRRRFYDAPKLGDKRAGFAVDIIRKVYALDEEAREFNCEARSQMRQCEPIPLAASSAQFTRYFSGIILQRRQRVAKRTLVQPRAKHDSAKRNRSVRAGNGKVNCAPYHAPMKSSPLPFGGCL